NDGDADLQPITLVIAGQTLKIDSVFFEQSQTATGTKIVKVAITDARFELSDGDSVIATIGPISGAFMLTAQGIAGKVTIGAILIPLETGVTLGWSSASLEFNTTPNQVNQTFGGQTLVLAQGRFFRVQILSATLTINSIQLTGSMSVEQATFC